VSNNVKRNIFAKSPLFMEASPQAHEDLTYRLLYKSFSKKKERKKSLPSERASYFLNTLPILTKMPSTSSSTSKIMNVSIHETADAPAVPIPSTMIDLKSAVV
jgi:hypothetical protein